ncbi:TPA: hypothetical protein ROF77_002129 [Enterobacter asburiae]|nr:hypothetical protein [Enterobacter asburiae]
MDESRKQFEQKIQHSYGEDYLVVNDDGDYVNWITADLWEFWQASRAAIEIELPDELTIEDCIDKDIDVCRATQFNLGVGKLEHAIRAAGIKVKE